MTEENILGLIVIVLWLYIVGFDYICSWFEKVKNNIKKHKEKK